MERPMNVTVRYFAVLRDQAGCSQEDFFTNETKARDIVNELISVRNLGLQSSLIRIAVNGVFVDDHTLVTEGDELVLIPPVAGG
jgi:molybdopterin converting factor small subunit